MVCNVFDAVVEGCVEFVLHCGFETGFPKREDSIYGGVRQHLWHDIRFENLCFEPQWAVVVV